jgi:CheY-like chemotaxis protein
MKKNPSIKRTILVVDDDKDDHTFLEMAIREVMPNAAIRSLYDGSEVKDFLLKKNAFEKEPEKLPDVIFLDLNMTKIGGRETTYLLKKDEDLRSIPVVILTTASNPGEKQELLRLGANDFYTKPVELSDLVRIVRSVSDRWL